MLAELYNMISVFHFPETVFHVGFETRKKLA